MDLNGLVELRKFNFLNERNSLSERVRLRFYLFRRGFILLAWLLTHNVDWYKRPGTLRTGLPK